MTSFNYRIKQILLLTLLVTLVLLSLLELRSFLPGVLGAITAYILARGSYYQLTFHRKWRKGPAAWFFILICIVLAGGLIYGTAALLMPKVQVFFSDPDLMIGKGYTAINKLQEQWGWTIVSEDTLSGIRHWLASYIPTLVNDTATLIGNLAILLFLLYYLLVHGKELELYLARIIPLNQSNIQLLAGESKRIIKASAIGIPLISAIQGVTAMIGYIIFGLHDFVLWGFITGVFAFFPIVGTMIVWIPLVITMYAQGDNLNATGLMFYSVIVTGNVDYLARITFLNKVAQVHPVVTVLGVIVGLGLFGFVGLIFGPLLVNYIILLFRIYSNEFIGVDGGAVCKNPR